MTQIEFENQLRELRHQKAQVMNQFNLMQNEIKEEIATKNRQIHELSEQVQRLKVKRAGIQEVRLKTEKEWGGRFRTLSANTRSRPNAHGTLLAPTPL
jgi:polyribonucleotide nucleotidyltransferase